MPYRNPIIFSDPQDLPENHSWAAPDVRLADGPAVFCLGAGIAINLHSNTATGRGGQHPQNQMKSAEFSLWIWKATKMETGNPKLMGLMRPMIKKNTFF